ncbi:DUF2798 domain-containing protein [Bradyrhizobium sp. JR3.5]
MLQSLHLWRHPIGIASLSASATGHFLWNWLGSWLVSWAVMLPVVLLAAPIVRSLSMALTREESTD